MPIFEFVKKEKIKKEIILKILDSKIERKIVEVKLIDGTSILELSYNKDKEPILSVPSKISKSYQEIQKKDQEILNLVKISLINK